MKDKLKAERDGHRDLAERRIRIQRLHGEKQTNIKISFRKRNEHKDLI